MNISAEALKYLNNMVTQANERHPANPFACNFRRTQGNLVEAELLEANLIAFHGPSKWRLTEEGYRRGS